MSKSIPMRNGRVVETNTPESEVDNEEEDDDLSSDDNIAVNSKRRGGNADLPRLVPWVSTDEHDYARGACCNRRHLGLDVDRVRPPSCAYG